MCLFRMAKLLTVTEINLMIFFVYFLSTIDDVSLNSKVGTSKNSTTDQQLHDYENFKLR